jgi:hypothetical protein
MSVYETLQRQIQELEILLKRRTNKVLFDLNLREIKFKIKLSRAQKMIKELSDRYKKKQNRFDH